MIFLKLVMLLAFVAFFGLLFAQVILPLIRGTVIFPMLFSREAELESAIAQAKTQKRIDEMASELSRYKPKQ